MAGLPTAAEVADFDDRVGEVAALVRGLHAGTVSPAAADRHLAAQRAAAEQTQQAQRAQQAQREKQAEEAADPARQAERARKVAELRAGIELRKRARARFEAHVADEAADVAGTDYRAWDLWTPSDEEEDALLAPSGETNPALRVFEQDIDARHARRAQYVKSIAAGAD